MDGSEATRAIRASHADWARTPIVGLTANAMAEEQEAFLRDGMNDILTKPLSREDLIRVIAEHVSDRPAKAEAGSEKAAAIAASAVAMSYLDELRDTFGVEKLQNLLDRFVAEVDDLQAFLKDKGTKDLSETAARVHKASGSAATFGAVALRSLLVDLENSAKTGDHSAAQHHIDAFPQVWSATRHMIRAERRAEPRQD
jgi:CheY-like chemotaxis protein